MNSKIKTSIQEKTLGSLRDKPRVALKWATGCGKSKMVIDFINYKVNNYISKPSILFVCAERAHIKNWQTEFQKWGLNADNTTIMCYNSLHKAEGFYDIIVFDEAHHMFSEKRWEHIKGMKADYVYLLSATLPFKKIMEVEDIFGKFEISSISLKKAIEKDILPEPRVYLIPLTLNSKEYNQEIKIGTGSTLPYIRWEDRAEYIFSKKPCIIQCTEFQKYIYLSASMEYWKKRYELSHNDFHKNKWVNLGSQRKRFLGELKTNYVRDLINTIDKRYVCFCASVAQAESISKKNTISSKRPSKYNQLIINAFNEKQINSLFAVGMITEGMNLTDIQVGIIVQLDGKERLFIQKFGRSMRADDPVSYIFYFKDTQDEVYLKKAIENIDEKYIKHKDITE